MSYSGVTFFLFTAVRAGIKVGALGWEKTLLNHFDPANLGDFVAWEEATSLTPALYTGTWGTLHSDELALWIS